MLAPQKKLNYVFSEVHEITDEEILAKEFLLQKTPTIPELTEFLPDGGPLQRYGIEYIIEGNKLKWSGKELDGFLIIGDKITLRYYAI